MSVSTNTPRRAPRLRAAVSMAPLAAVLLMTLGFGGTPAMAERSVTTCQPTKVKVVSSDTYRSTTSTTFVPLTEAAVQFVHKGSQPSCVMIRLEAYAATVDGAVMTVSASLDGATVEPDAIQLTSNPVYLPVSWTFILPKVPPGKHTISFQFRTNNSAKGVIFNSTNTFVHFAG